MIRRSGGTSTAERRKAIEESLDFCGVKTTESAAALVAAAGERSGLSDDDAMALAARPALDTPACSLEGFRLPSVSRAGRLTLCQR